MKKVLCLLMILTLTLTIPAACDKNKQQSEEQSSEQSSEQITIPTEPSEGLEFRSSGDGTCALIGIGTCTDTYVVIPDTSPEGERVTFIEYGALSGCDHLVGIKFPASMEHMGGSLYGCSNLVSITVEKGNKKYYGKNDCLIGIDTYYDSTYGDYEIITLIAGCKNSIIPNEIDEIGDSAFGGCIGLTSVIIPDGVTSIGAGAFNGCTGLTEIDIPDSVVSIGDRAFADCKGLTEIAIPEGVETIGYGLIDGCENLQSISLPSTLMSIGGRIIMSLGVAPSLERITVDPGNSVYQSIDNCLIERSTGTMIAGCKTSVIPNTVTNLGSFTFAGCAGLTSIAIPNSVISIGDSAFSGCTSLTSITIPDSVTYIGSAVFEECSDLDSINVDSGNKVYHSINNCVIESKSGELVFGGNHSTIPDGVTSIGSWAFSGADITYIKIPEGVRSIENGAFYNCGELKSVVFPNSLKVIGVQAFSECASLTDFTIPDSITFIGDEAFSNCSSLTNICIPSSIEYIGYAAFWGCNNLTSLSVSTGNNFYHSIDNCLIETVSGILIQGCNNSIIPDSVLDIGNGAFYGCDNIINIDIPSSVTRVGDISFADCTGLTSIIITDSVMSIGEGAFAECIALKDVYYTGTEQEWMAISLGSDNELLQAANIHYNYVPEE